MSQGRTVSELLESSRLLPASDRDAALEWADAFEQDVRSAIEQCSRARWLAALARALGEDRVVDRWYVTQTETPQHVARLKRIAALPREEQMAELTRGPFGPSEEALDARIDELRAALNTDTLEARAAEPAPVETSEEREARVIDAALADCAALADEDLDGRTFAGRWGLIGGRTFARVSGEGATRFIRESKKYQKFTSDPDT